MSADSKNLTDRLNAILEQLSGLSVNEIKVMLCNVESEVNQSSIVSLSRQEKAVFNSQLRPPK